MIQFNITFRASNLMRKYLRNTIAFKIGTTISNFMLKLQWQLHNLSTLKK
jgi:hypothetical protein